MTLSLTAREELLLKSALCPDPKIASVSWKGWSEQIALENAPLPELRILPAAYANLVRLAPELPLSQKLRGKVRATFARNRALAHATLPAFSALSGKVPIMLTKGIALCVQFDAWSYRTMGDIDCHIPYDMLGSIAEILPAFGWAPKYGMTWASLMHRSSLRRNSWNIAKGNGDIDIHWRFDDGEDERELEQAFWSSGRTAELFGQRLLLPSPEFSIAASLRHCFKEGTRGDLLQTLVDSAAWLVMCSAPKLADVLQRARLSHEFGQVADFLSSVGAILPMPLRASPQHRELRRTSLAPRLRRRVEARLLRRPRLYRLWEKLGRPAGLERVLLRFGGPLSRPLAPSGVAKDDYDMRDCAVIDEIGGPGWAWPEPEMTCFWSDRADNRLLVPLIGVEDHLMVISFGTHRFHSPNAIVDVFANGRFLTVLNLAQGLSKSNWAILIPRKVLYEPWVELAFRPKDYKGELTSDYTQQRSLPVSRLRVFHGDRLDEAISDRAISPIVDRILNGQQPHKAKFDCVRQKMIVSPFKNNPGLPHDFNPVLYVLSYDDLLAAEVDPYQHFIESGKTEGRQWR
jgi:Uncharacterised nucleotidyltransferase